MHIRLDEVTAAAVAELRAFGFNPAELVREALRRRAADLRSDPSSADRELREREELRAIARAFDPLVATLDVHEGEAEDAEVIERFLAAQPEGVLPVIRPWRDPDEREC